MEACKCGTCMTCLFGEPISVYTRAQALEDGALVDVASTAREAGFTMPVALTRAVWTRCVEVPQGVMCQDEAGRLWDILNMLRFAVRSNAARSEILFRLYVRNDNRRPRLTTLKAICAPSDEGSPCITICEPRED